MRIYEHLVRPTQELVQLLDPPFDHATLAPGYIKGYSRACGKTAASTRTPPSGR